MEFIEFQKLIMLKEHEEIYEFSKTQTCSRIEIIRIGYVYQKTKIRFSS